MKGRTWECLIILDQNDENWLEAKVNDNWLTSIKVAIKGAKIKNSSDTIDLSRL